MKNMKKTLLVSVSLVLVAALAVGLTLAYLKDTDSDVNVMTMGNVSIEQLEYERAVNEDGTYKTYPVASRNNALGYELTEFKQAKPLYPAVLSGNDITFDDTKVYFEQLNDGSTKGYQAPLAGLENVQDKFVFVKNTGKTDAYVRTLIAYEVGDDTDAFGTLIMINYNQYWTAKDIGVIEIDGNNYYVVEYLYGDNSKHPGGAVKPGEFTYNSLAQIYLKPVTTNEDVEAIDGNDNGTYDVLVLSQAIQTAGFDDAKTALDTGFGKSTEKAAEWFGGVLAEHNTPKVDVWDGTVDTSWYNDTDKEFDIETAEDIAGLSALVESGNTFEGKTIKLGMNLDLASLPFNPIGHYKNGQSFNGTFDGQGYTIYNLYEQSNLDDKNGGWLYEGEYYGLFAYTDGATIKNLTVADAYISSGRNEASAVVGYANNTTFSNITVSNTTLIVYNNSAGSVAAECFGDCSFTDITVDADTVVGPLWGTYDASLGGVVGMVKTGNNITFKNVDVSCKIDAINDVASNYQYWLYRYSGMLIGKVDGVNGVANPTGYVTCENVTVTYGDWVNYHYCEDADLGAGSYNDPGEYKFARVEAGTGTDGLDLSACNHNADESHNVLIVFDQLFGGGQGISGLKTFDGVTVIYNH